MLMKLEESDERALGFIASGKLTDNDYKNFLIPEIQAALHHTPAISLLFQLENFRGWDLKAAWDDLVFGLQINQSVKRIAILGDRRWERWIARLVSPFSHGEVRYYEAKELDQAWEWLRST